MLAKRSDRWWSLVLMSLALPAGLAPFVDGGSFSAQIFDTIKGIAPIEAWGAAWLLAATAALHAAMTGRWCCYVVANTLTLGLSTAWLAAVLWSRFIDDQQLTLTAIGLWMFPMAACVHAIATPTQVTPVTKGG